MPTHTSGGAKPRMLCVRSKAADPVLLELLPHFDVTSVSDARLALRKGSLGTYDVFLAHDAHGARAPVMVWRHMRRIDTNTPFVMVCGEQVPAEITCETKPECDLIVYYPSSSDELLRAIRRMLTAAEARNMLARSEEARAISEEIRGRLTVLEERVLLSRQSLARAQEHVLRAIALRSFIASGGTRSHFEEVWPDVFESALAASYDEKKGEGRGSLWR